MSKIINIIGREILDSRGNPTIEVDVLLKNGSFGRFSSPSGASIGSYEAVELRDKETRYRGMGVKKGIDIINEQIFPILNGYNACNQKEIDQILIDLDGTKNKERLGSNIVLGVSVAVAKAASSYYKLPLYRYLGGIRTYLLPVPIMNVINGGLHADNSIDFQEFMIIPIGAENIQEAIRYGSEVFYALKKSLQDFGYLTNVGDEGGFAPNIKTVEDSLDFIVEAIEKSGFTPGKDVSLGIDCASTELFNNGKYIYKNQQIERDMKNQAEYLNQLVQNYPIIFIEDGMSENDWEGWKYLTDLIGNKCFITGDDLFTTNKIRLQQGIKMNIANSILIKPNQIGTLSETLDTIEISHKSGYNVIISHRSGETEDSTISDISVATNCGWIKAGSLSRSDRLCKYNQLIRIEEELGIQAKYNKFSNFYNLKKIY